MPMRLRHLLNHQPTNGLIVGDRGRWRWAVVVRYWDGGEERRGPFRDKRYAASIAKFARDDRKVAVAWIEPVEVDCE